MCRVLIKEEFMNFKERMEMCVLRYCDGPDRAVQAVSGCENKVDGFGGSVDVLATCGCLFIITTMHSMGRLKGS